MAQKWVPKAPQPSPDLRAGAVGWLQINLFSSLGNTLLTILGGAVLYITIPEFLNWAVLNANWVGDSRGVCDAASAGGKTGACWVFIKVRLGMFLYGFYPEPERWRVNLTLLVLAFNLLPILGSTLLKSLISQTAVGLFGGLIAYVAFGPEAAGIMVVYYFLPFLLGGISQKQVPLSSVSGNLGAYVFATFCTLVCGLLAYIVTVFFISEVIAAATGLVATLIGLLLFFVRRLSILGWRWILLFSIYPVFGFFMLVGGVFGMDHVETHYWGGLFLTLVVAGTGMATALPIGILLALGRRSELPVIKTVCVSFIEFVRGVPLVSVLFMASVMFPLFLPESVTFNKLLRALIGIAFFYAAYMAEVIRGGLQAIPKGQYEAAEALGWAYWKMMGIIILPQTLRLVIPGLANNFLSLLKDTTLVAVIGLLDLLGIAKAAMADSEWLGFTKEAYVFAAVVFWVFCFAISRYSVHLERKYHTSYQ